jgi:hypothetical protein
LRGEEGEDREERDRAADQGETAYADNRLVADATSSGGSVRAEGQ